MIMTRSRRSLRSDVNAAAARTLPVAESTMAHIEQASRLVWGVDSLRPMQRRALTNMFVEGNRKLLLVDRTGGGKSHTLRLMASVLMGVHLYCCPLLALMADVILKFAEGSDDYGAIHVLNLDDLASTSKKIRDQIVAWLKEIDKDCELKRRKYEIEDNWSALNLVEDGTTRIHKIKGLQ